MRVDQVMSSPTLTVTRRTSVKDAASLMAAHGFTLLPVVDDDLELVGVVSEGDVVSDRFPSDVRFRDDEAQAPVAAATVGEVMTRDVIEARGWDDIRGLVRRMRAARVRAVPVCRERAVVGIVTYRDLVRALARTDGRIARDVERRLAVCFRPGAFAVLVRDGEVVLTDRMDRPTEWHTARTLIEQIPGVVSARVVPELVDTSRERGT